MARRTRLATVYVLFALALALTGTASGAVLADDPIAYWPLDEKTGTIAFDETGNADPDPGDVDPDSLPDTPAGHDGVYVNSPLLGVPGAPPPDADTAVEFNGASQYVEVPYDAELNPSTYTIEAWVRPLAYPSPGSTGTDSKAIFCSRDDLGVRGFMLYLDNYVGHPQWSFVVGHGISRRYVYDASGLVPGLGTWHHVVGTFDGAALRLWVDGVDVTSAQLDDGGGNTPGPGPAGFFPNTTRPSYIGACSGSSGPRLFFPGTIDEVGLYNGVLTPDQIRNHHARTLAASRPRRPLIFIPGATGSYIEREGELIWPREESLATSRSDSFLDGLRLSSSGTDLSPPAIVSRSRGWDGVILRTAICNDVPTLDLPLPPVPPGEYPAIGNPIQRRHVCVQLARNYVNTQNALATRGYKTRNRFAYMLRDSGVNLFPYAYDWRKSAEHNAAGLLRRINRVLALRRFRDRGITSVDILAHSQGGLVTSALLNHPDVGNRVHRVASLGTPYLGTPKSLSVLKHAKPCQAEIFGVCILNMDRVQNLVKFFPGSLETLPSRRYWDAATPPIFEIVRIFGNTARFMTWAEIRGELHAKFGNGELIDQAQAFHDYADRWEHRDHNVEIMRFAGTGRGTIRTIREFLYRDCRAIVRIRTGGECELKFKTELRYGSGDGTVIRHSAGMRNCSRGFDIPGAADKSFVTFVSGYGHEQLAHDGGIIRRAVDFLRAGSDRSSKCADQSSSSFATASTTDGTASTSTTSTTVDGPDEHALAGTELATDGPLIGNVADQDAHLTGIINPDLDIAGEAIPGSAFNEGIGTASYFTTADAALHGAWTVTDAGEVALKVRRYGADAIQTMAAALPVDVQQGARVSLPYSQPTDFSTLAVRIDDDANGTVDRIIPFEAPLTGEAAEDGLPPESALDIVKTQGKKCLQGTRVTITATDEGGAGVARIEYELNASNTKGVYTGPLTLPPHGEIFVRAIDRAGNIEIDPKIGVLDDHPSIRRIVSQFLVPHVNTTGCLDYEGDVDWWGFELTSGTHQFQLIGLKDDYDLALYDSGGALLATSERRGSTAEKIRLDLAAGRYFLRVTGYAGAWNNQHPYRLNVNTLGGGTETTSTSTSTSSTSTTDGAYLEDGSTASSTGPAGLWRLGEPGGSTTAGDASGGRNDGSYVGDPLLGLAGAVYGDADTAATFDGRTQYVEAPYGAPLNSSHFSVEAWVKVTGGAGTWRSVVTSRDALNGNLYGYVVYAGADDRWHFWTGGGGSAWQMVSGSVVSFDRWTHVAATYDGTTARLYVDGSLAASAAVAYAPNTERPLRIGAGATEAGATYFLPGAIDEVAVYAGVRTDSEIYSAYSAGFPPVYEPPPPSGCSAKMNCTDPVPPDQY